MKWGRKKTLPSSSSSASPSPFSSAIPQCSQPSSFISHVFPVSWLSKFKHKTSANSAKPKNPRKINPRGRLNSPLVNSPSCVSFGPGDHGDGKGKFYGFDDDGDAFWRLSFGQDNAEEKSKRVGLGSSVWYGFDGHDQLRVPVLSCPNCTRKGTALRSPRSGQSVREPRLKSRRELGNPGKRSTHNYVARTVVTSPGLRTIQEQREDLRLRLTAEEENSGGEMRFALPSLKENGERKSLYVSMEKPRKRTTQSNNCYSNRVRAFSPRAETCRVKALEDMKKTKLRVKKKSRKKEAETSLESFAVVKSSYDLRKDFKESMVEMILEKKMSRLEELEELLACYLTLNSDDHHDLIIKVFKEVWLELIQLQSQRVSRD